MPQIHEQPWANSSFPHTLWPLHLRPLSIMDLPFNHMDLQISLRTCKYCQSLKSFLFECNKMGRLDWYYLLTYWLFDLRASSFLFIRPCKPDFLHQPCNKTSGNCGNVVCSTNGRVLCFSSFLGRIGVPWITEHSSAINRCNVVAPPKSPSWDWDWQSPSSLRFPDPCYVMVLWIAYSLGHHRSGQMIVRYYKSQSLFPLPSFLHGAWAFDVSVICLIS